MSQKQIISAAEAAEWVQDHDTIVTSGFVASHMPESLNKALEQRFLSTGHPAGLTLLYAAAQGNRDGSGADHFAHEGMLKRVIGGHFNMVPSLVQMINEDKVEAYNLPQGTLAQLFRDIAAHRPGTLTHVGLGTFVDPRIEGGRLNTRTTEQIVSLVDIMGEEKLLYHAHKVDIAFIRGTFADENGNVTLEHEACTCAATSIAQAAKNSGGKVVVQVERIVKNGSLDPKLVKIPGICVDALVLCEDPADQAQSQGCDYDGSFTGEFRVPLTADEPLAMSMKKIIARRAAMELQKGDVVNLGIGTPEYVALVANEEGIGDRMTLTVEAGAVGGVPQGGVRFGCSANVEAILDEAYQFDFYDGGGLDIAYLGLAQADRKGNVNVSKFGTRIAGCGGFINITQNAKKVVFCGTFTAGGFKAHVEDGRLVIDREGTENKFPEEVGQITFSGDYAVKTGQPVLFVTERAVFELRKDGLWLTEVAPGIDPEEQIFSRMSFRPQVEEGGPAVMEERIFREALMGIKERFS